MKKDKFLTIIAIAIVVLLGIRCIGRNSLHSADQGGTQKTDTIFTDTCMRLSVFNIQKLDAMTNNWHPTEQIVMDFFTLSDEVTLSDVVADINKNYIPISITGILIKDNKEFTFLLNATGVGILEFPNEDGLHDEYHYFIKNALTENFFPKESAQFNQLDVKILSKTKDFKSTGEDKLDEWCAAWSLSATDINKYIELCKEGSNTYMYQRFMNYPCSFDGYMVWKNTIYYYSLEVSGMTRLQNLNDENEDLALGCFDQRGLKYVYTIEHPE